MRRAPLLILGASGALCGTAAALAAPGAVWQIDGPASFGLYYDGEAMLAIASATLFLFLPTVALSYAFLVVDMRAQAPRWRTEMALGSARGTIIRRESLRGLAQGAVAGAAGLVLGATATIVATGTASEVLGQHAWPLLMQSWSFLLLLTLASGLSSLLAATRATATSPAELHEPALEPTPLAAPASRRSRAILAIVGAVALTVLAVARISPEHASQPLLFGLDAASMAALTLWILMFAAIDHLLVEPTRRLAVGAARGLSELVEGVAGGAGTALALAGQAMQRRSTLRRTALLTTTLLVTVVAYVMTTGALSAARVQAAEPYTTYMEVSTVSWEDSPPLGVVQEKLDPSVVDALLADSRVVAAPAGLIVTSSEDGEIWSSLTTANGNDTVLVVDPADLERVSAAGYRPLGFQDGTLTSLDMGATSLDGHHLFRVATPSGEPMVTRAWAEEAYGDIPVSTVLLWSADPDLSDDATFALFEQALADGGAGSELATIGGGGTYVTGADSPLVGIALAAPFAMLGVGLTVALAISTARDSRRDLATMAALGATPRTLRLIPALESGLTIASATLVGTAVGVTASVLWNHPTLLRAGAPLDLGEVLWGLGWELGHAHWLAPLAVGAIALVAAVPLSFVLGSGMAQGTPVEELRTADKEGVL